MQQHQTTPAKSINQEPGKQIAALLSAQKKQIALALPRHMTPDRMLRISLTELRKSAQLQKANPLSFIGAVIQCAQLGLEPGNALGHVYLIPYKDEVQVVLGFQGMIELALRSGAVESIYCFPVFEGDKFDVKLGLEPNIEHVPDPEGDEDPAKLRCVYAVAKLKNGGKLFQVVSRKKLEETKRRATEFKRNSPWNTDFVEMCRKTGVRRLFKYLPKSAEMARAAELDEKAELEENQTIDITNFETSEPITLEQPNTVASTNEVKAHQLKDALGAAWLDALAAGVDPQVLLNTSETELANANEIKQQNSLLMLREATKKKKEVR